MTFAVTELLEGTTLRERLDEGSMSPVEAVGYAKRFADGLAAAAVSHDTPEILAHFEDRMGGFRYPLLADPDSTMIRAFGVLNRNVPESDPEHRMARPGTFVVDANGIVTSKYFEPGHRQRVTAETMLVREFGSAGERRCKWTPATRS